MKNEKFERVVEWEEDEFGFFSNWIMVVFVAMFYPIFYIQERRKVYWRKKE